MKSSSLKKEYRYFLENRKRIVAEHHRKFLVIRDEKVIGSFDTRKEAYFEPQKENPLGTFLIQEALYEEEMPLDFRT